MDGSEKSLAAAVVLQAVNDARAPKPGKPTEPNKKRMATYRKRLLDWRRDRDEALSFLTADNGAWKASRELWCALAGMDPESIRAKSAEMFA